LCLSRIKHIEWRKGEIQVNVSWSLSWWTQISCVIFNFDEDLSAREKLSIILCKFFASAEWLLYLSTMITKRNINFCIVHYMKP
jgi:hypothetical protein